MFSAGRLTGLFILSPLILGILSLSTLSQVGAALATTTTKSSLFTYGVPNMALNVCIVLEIVLSLVLLAAGACLSLTATTTRTCDLSIVIPPSVSELTGHFW